MTATKVASDTGAGLREARALAKQVRDMLRAENAHARGIQADRKAGREDGTSTSRDDVDMIHANLYRDWPAKRLARLIEALSTTTDATDAVRVALEAALCAPDWSKSLGHVHDAIAALPLAASPTSPSFGEGEVS